MHSKTTKTLADYAGSLDRMKRRAWAAQSLLTPIVLRNKGEDQALEGLLQLVDDLVDDLEEIDGAYEAEIIASAESKS